MREQQHLTGTLKASLREARKQLADSFLNTQDARHYLLAHSKAVDGIIARLWQALELGQHASLIAVGGYGRAQLFPASDIDLLILLPDEASLALNDEIARLIGLMWDIGLEVGHSVRTVDECLHAATRDITIQTNLLEHRLVAGNANPFHALCNALERVLDPLVFFEGKVLEQQQRHSRFLGVSNNLEPNLKESPGGLRDLHTLLWISKAIGLGDAWEPLILGGILTAAEARLIRHGERQLQRLRIHLHLLARRREDRLIFDLQQQLGQAMGLPDNPVRRASERVMQLYFQSARTVSQLNGILLPNLQARLYSQASQVTAQLNPRFNAVNGLLGISHPTVFDETPSAILEAFHLLQQHPELSGFEPQTLRALWHARVNINKHFRQDPVNIECFMQIMRSDGLTRCLRKMNLYGVLGKYLPAFGKIVGQMQHDLFHVYTVDEHILMVVRNLRRFGISAFNHEYPFLSSLINDFERPEVLYLAGLFHDIAKGRGGDHSQLGKADARDFCKRHRLCAEDTDLVVWLIAQHLTLSTIAQKQDIYDPAVIQHVVSLVGTPRRLAALYLLTVADIRGTSPKVWNGWKAKLLEDLYQSTLKALEQGGAVDRDSMLEKRRAQAQAMLRLYAVPEGAEQTFWSTLDTDYFLRHEAREIAWHARVLNRRTTSKEALVSARLSDDKESIQVLVYSADQAALFARICAFFGKTHYSIADARIYTTRQGYALDTFHVFIPEQHEGNYRDMVNFIEFELAGVIRRAEPLAPANPGRVSRHLKHFPIPPQIMLRSNDQASHYVLSIVAGDRPGLLAQIALILAEHDITVHSAKIMTLGSRAEDAFLVSGPSLGDDKTVVALEAELVQALKI